LNSPNTFSFNLTVTKMSRFSGWIVEKRTKFNGYVMGHRSVENFYDSMDYRKAVEVCEAQEGLNLSQSIREYNLHAVSYILNTYGLSTFETYVRSEFTTVEQQRTDWKLHFDNACLKLVESALLKCSTRFVKSLRKQRDAFSILQLLLENEKINELLQTDGYWIVDRFWMSVFNKLQPCRANRRHKDTLFLLFSRLKKVNLEKYMYILYSRLLPGQFWVLKITGHFTLKCMYTMLIRSENHIPALYIVQEFPMFKTETNAFELLKVEDRIVKYFYLKKDKGDLYEDIIDRVNCLYMLYMRVILRHNNCHNMPKGLIQYIGEFITDMLSQDPDKNLLQYNRDVHRNLAEYRASVIRLIPNYYFLKNILNE